MKTRKPDIAQDEVARVVSGEAPWLRFSPDGALVVIAVDHACAATLVERVTLRMKGTKQRASNDLLTVALNRGLLPHAKRRGQQRGGSPNSRNNRPSEKPFSWMKIPVDVRVSIVQQLKQMSFPWIRAHEVFATELGIRRSWVIALIAAVACFGFEDPFLLGKRDILELRDATGKWHRAEETHAVKP